jgi:proteasome accessory factor C
MAVPRCGYNGNCSHNPLECARNDDLRAGWLTNAGIHSKSWQLLTDGRYELRVPYHDARELVMDILKYGPDVQVVEPPALRTQVAERLRDALEHYAGG